MRNIAHEEIAFKHAEEIEILFLLKLDRTSEIAYFSFSF